MLTGNKGEWSEIYTLLKLLGDKKIHIGDKELKEIPNLIYPIIKILRDESNGNYEYHVDDQIRVIEDANELLTIPVQEFKDRAQFLLSEIKKNAETFAIPEIEAFLTHIKCSTLKAKSSAKTDIRIVIHDLKTNMQPELGFSIKSQLGSPSTLLNAGRTTNFIYAVDGSLSADVIEAINSIEGRGKIKARMQRIYDEGGWFAYANTEKEIFNSNLVLIDSCLPQILAEMVKLYFLTNDAKIVDLVSALEQNNPLKFNTKYHHRYYEYKIKKFLTEIAVGMMPGTVWEGVYDATGGYLVVREDGEILAYHLYNRNEFEDYLFHNTKLDTASSSRHGFGQLYEEDGAFFFKLNLQIRFVK